MNTSTGYIYVRCHPAYDVEDACKLGMATNIPDRDTQYSTGEIRRGNFKVVFEIFTHDIRSVEKSLQDNFIEFNIRYDAGTEFYSKQIIEYIEPFIIEQGINYKKMTELEIDAMTRRNRDVVAIPLTPITSPPYVHIDDISGIPTYTPRMDQVEIIEKSVIHFKDHDKGILVLMCGVGKTLISLWVSKELSSNTILIGVPNILLLKQWVNIVRTLFKDIPLLTICAGVDRGTIEGFLEKNGKKCIVITTYASAHKVLVATQNIRFVFDIKILDEVHHLTSSRMKSEDTVKRYVLMLNIISIKQLSLTATLKLLDAEEPGIGESIISNDNITHFGKIIDKKGLLWAINKNIICDYEIQTVVSSEEDLNHMFEKFHIVEEPDRRLFLSAYASLKSIYSGNSHHLLIYSNNKDNSTKLVLYLSMLLDNNYFDIPHLYYSDYHSDMKPNRQNNIISMFENSKFGIITCVYCLGEGWDFPLLDGVVFSENMSSIIRILQSILRAFRKNNADINKKAKIILPILDRDDWMDNGGNPDLKKVREVIYQMALEDETIVQKIKVVNMDINMQRHKRDIISIASPGDTIFTGSDFGDYDDELTQRLILKTVKRGAISITYEIAKKIVSAKNIMSMEEYFALCKNDYRLVRDPMIVYSSQFTNWVDYLNIKHNYYDLETCKAKVIQYISYHPEIRKYYADLRGACNEISCSDDLFPPSDFWVDYYKVSNLRDIISISIYGNKKKSGMKL